MKTNKSNNAAEAIGGGQSNPNATLNPPLESGSAKGISPLIHLKKILVPVDFSKSSKKALQYASSFAGQFGAELMLLHVMLPAVTAPAFDTLPQEMAESFEDAEKGLEEFKSFVGDGIAAKSVIRKGSPHVEIIDAAKEFGVDLVIISTHGRTGLSHVLLGGTTEKVVRRAGCPVLIVREHEHEFINVSNSIG